MAWRRELVAEGRRIKLKNAWHVAHVYPGSPAADAGIKTGWHLAAIDGKPVTPLALDRARRVGKCKLSFRDNAGNAQLWQHSMFPFGIHLSQPLEHGLRRRIAKRLYSDEDRSTLVELFEQGDLQAFTSLIGVFQAALGVPQGVFVQLGLREPQPRDLVPEKPPVNVLHEFQTMLALGFLGAGKPALALASCDAADVARAELGQYSYSSNVIAMDYFVRAHLKAEAGDLAKAKQFADAALEMRPDFPSLQRLVWTLSGEAPRHNDIIPLGETISLNYELPNLDPVGEIPPQQDIVSLKTALDTMLEGQLHVIIAYGGYRSNYYGNIDIERLAFLHAAFPKVISSVHIVTCSDYALSPEHRHDVERFALNVGLPISVLWDESNAVMNEIGSSGSPVRCVLDKSGHVLSTAPFAQERGFWEALEAQRTFSFDGRSNSSVH